jgi:hypothetical protein
MINFKDMKQSYFLFCLVFSVFVNAQIINFPDANFKAKLLQPNVAFDEYLQVLTLDSNSDGEIEVSEIQNVFLLDVSNATISDLTGISNFSGLKSLNCSNNLLTNITIDSAINLWGLDANHNLLTSVSFTFAPYDSDFEFGLGLSYNNFTTLTLSDMVLYSLDISHNNQLSSLTLNNVSSDYFSADYCNLNSIQFVGQVSFNWAASFTHNQFSLLDFSGAYLWGDLSIGNNVVDNVHFGNSNPNTIYYTSNNTTVDFGNFSGVTSCDPYDSGRIIIQDCPNLQNANLKNGYNHTFIVCDDEPEIFQIPALHLEINNCPNLSHICVDELEQPYIQQRINFLGLQNQVQVNTNCTLNPDGTLVTTSYGFSDQFTISPVPVQNVLQIQSKDNLEIQNIEIYNNLGQIVQKEIGNQQSIDVSRLSKGNYYLKIYTDNLTSVKQFLKE